MKRELVYRCGGAGMAFGVNMIKDKRSSCLSLSFTTVDFDRNNALSKSCSSDDQTRRSSSSATSSLYSYGKVDWDTPTRKTLTLLRPGPSLGLTVFFAGSLAG